MSEHIRPSWDEYFMELSNTVSKRGTCNRKRVGTVIVKNRTVISCGYNGSIKGMPHCDDVGHMMEDDHCVRVIHSEVNAIAQAALHGASVNGSDLYVTASPCWNCFKLVANAGIKRIIYGEFYRDKRIFDAATSMGIELIHFPLSLPVMHAIQ